VLPGWGWEAQRGNEQARMAEKTLVLFVLSLPWPSLPARFMQCDL
jgi:hypothetical protein